MKQVDWDGAYEYSDTRSVVFENPLAVEVKAYPNPFTNELTLEGHFEANQVIVVYDTLGKIVQVVSITDTNDVVHVDIGSSANGLYVFVLRDERGNVLKRLSILKN